MIQGLMNSRARAVRPRSFLVGQYLRRGRAGANGLSWEPAVDGVVVLTISYSDPGKGWPGESTVSESSPGTSPVYVAGVAAGLAAGLAAGDACTPLKSTTIGSVCGGADSGQKGSSNGWVFALTVANAVAGSS